MGASALSSRMLDLDLSPREQMARLLGRKDMLRDLQPLMKEAGELAERYSAEADEDAMPGMLLQQMRRALELTQLLGRITGAVASAGEDLHSEMKLLGLTAPEE